MKEIIAIINKGNLTGEYHIDTSQLFTKEKYAFIFHKSKNVSILLCKANNYNELIEKAKKRGAKIL